MKRESSPRAHARSRTVGLDGLPGGDATLVEHAAEPCERPGVGHDHAAVARLLHALAEPHRLSMVHLLAVSEHRVVDLTQELGLAQSTVSVHLATLREAGLVDVRREGRSSWYRLARPEVAHILADAERVVAAGRASRVVSDGRAADAPPTTDVDRTFPSAVSGRSAASGPAAASVPTAGEGVA